MKLTTEQIKNCLDKAQSHREVYFTTGHSLSDVYVGVNKLLEIIGRNKEIALWIHKDRAVDHDIYSFIEVDSRGAYQIVLLDGMTNCWNRFCLCKELFHVVIDEPQSRSSSVIEHLADFRSSLIGADGRDSSVNEILAEFAAMQFLFPYAKRQKLADELKQRESRGEVKSDIFQEFAVQLRIPRVLLEDYMGDYWMNFFSSIFWMGRSDDR
jgi:hypothetical protein